ncbi:MAG TPA: thiol reductant ABC exporter subunit CydC [Acidimicrobiales bacterium]|nr:thiol reductant ABC exporter subunit CydC [Acidimicrobiales bacterium]
MSVRRRDGRSRGPLARILRIGAPDPRRFLLGTALGTTAALCTVGLLACSGALIDKAALRPPLETLTLLMAAVQLLALARGPLRYAERLVSHDAALGALGRVRLWLYDQVAPRSPAGVAGWRSGDLLTRATADVDLLQDVYLRGVGPLVTAAVTSLVAVGAVALVLPAAGLVLGVCLLTGTVGASALAWSRRRPTGRSGSGHEGERALRGALAADLVELLTAAPDLVAMGRDEEYLERVLASDAELERRARRRSWSDGAVGAVVVAATGAAVVGTLAVATGAIAAHRLPGFMVAVLPLVALGAFDVVLPAADAVSRLADHTEAAERLVSVADLEVPVVDPGDPAPLPEGTGIGFEDAVLRYLPDGPRVLDGFDLGLAPGRRVAVVGPSGAGKSSVVNVLLRFWGLETGTARLGGSPLDTLRQDDVRSRIGWVGQDAHLFPTTVGGNIAVARPGASPDQVAAAARDAQLGPWIDGLPLGLDTPVGERGAQLSGGQRQRVALARALLAGAPVLVLDEPTSGLDRPTARRLLHDVHAATEGTTLLLITHRDEDLAHADEVVVVLDGRVVGRYRGSSRAGGDVGDVGGSGAGRAAARRDARAAT